MAGTELGYARRSDHLPNVLVSMDHWAQHTRETGAYSY